MNQLTKILTLIVLGKYFRVSTASEKLTKWENKDTCPEYNEVLENLLDANKEIQVEIGVRNGWNPNGGPKIKLVDSFLIIKNPEPIQNYNHRPMLSGMENYNHYTPQSSNVQVDILKEKINDLKEIIADQKEEIKSIKSENKTFFEKNNELTLRISTIDKENELARKMDEFKSENSLSGVLKTLTSQESIDSLGSIISAVKGDSNNNNVALGNTDTIDLGSDLKNAILGKLKTMDNDSAELLWASITHENFNVQLEQYRKSKQQ